MKIKKETIVYPLPSDQLLSKEEGFWRVELPLEYKEFIKINNGGAPEIRSFICNDHNYSISRFLCILENPTENEFGIFDIDATKSQLDERLIDDEDLLGVALLPIAVLFAGDFLCLDFRESRNNPKVCVWDHENSGEFDPVSYLVANSFEEFLTMLTE
ncbi:MULTISPECIES: SMI1/KNR4 family protein [Paenibacillus]|uniref:SMI1/KNR4 family protein n=1 Tax=Paenibacillus TaxID=44249 RepID=UPI00096F04DD|nr:SMI1/KNR4 family protein [Paenibacillus odorifer]OMD19161.1 SMI1/KNR4 family protein [Paenibacillus odorifer]OMD25158.1 SMI1/KNR4 family protein [Paenibacillus odorifer]OME58299.1 SMI1/KNR4 family protein [Paenibacillus odorifer]